MHELAITENILEIALRHAEEAKARRVKNLFMVLGQISTVVDDSVQFYWDIISQDTIAEGAKLHFRRIPLELHCLDCGHRYRPESGSFTCPGCASVQVQVVTGDEFFLEAIDVEP